MINGNSVKNRKNLWTFFKWKKQWLKSFPIPISLYHYRKPCVHFYLRGISLYTREHSGQSVGWELCWFGHLILHRSAHQLRTTFLRKHNNLKLVTYVKCIRIFTGVTEPEDFFSSFLIRYRPNNWIFFLFYNQCPKVLKKKKIRHYHKKSYKICY